MSGLDSSDLAGLPTLPARFLHARSVRLGDVLQLRKDVIHPRDNPSGPAIFVGLEHIQSGTGRRIGMASVEMSRLTGRKPRFRQGDIVYGYLRPYLNKVWLADFDGLCSVDQYVFAVRTDLANAEYLAWFMRSPAFLAHAPIKETPGQLPRIRTHEVASVKLDLPPLLEQRRIVALISDQMAAVERARAAAVAQLMEIDELPASLLRQAFRGET
jgi:type I restriction enzyme, S subunit